MYSSANDIQFYPIGRDIPENETSKYKKSILWSRSDGDDRAYGHADRLMKSYETIFKSIETERNWFFSEEMTLKLKRRLKIHSERTVFTKLIMKLKQFWNMSSFSDMLQLILGQSQSQSCAMSHHDEIMFLTKKYQFRNFDIGDTFYWYVSGYWIFKILAMVFDTR